MYARMGGWGKRNAAVAAPCRKFVVLGIDGNGGARRLTDHKAAKNADHMIKDTTMVLKKTLMLLALSAVLAGSVSTLAHAEGMDGPGPMPMLNFDAIDSDKDGKITTAEFDAFKAAEFATADTNKDGQLSADEIAAKHVADMTARAADMAAKMIERMDDNGDGQLSADEMAKGPRAPTLFERADADGDGAITKAEADAMQQEMGQHHDHGKHHSKG